MNDGMAAPPGPLTGTGIRTAIEKSLGKMILYPDSGMMVA